MDHILFICIFCCVSLYCKSQSIFTGEDVNMKVSLNIGASFTELQLSCPFNVWCGISFDATSMTDGTFAVIYNPENIGDEISDAFLDQFSTPSLISSQWTLQHISTVDNQTTITATRENSNDGMPPDYPDFNALATGSSINIIIAHGTTPTFGYHGNNRISSTISKSQRSLWEEYFDHYTFLRAGEDYRLYWKIIDEEYIEIGLEVQSSGWIGFGLSPDNTMGESDIIMGWIDANNRPYLQRRHVISINDRFPVFDEDISDDLMFSEYDAINSITRLHFRRELFPCADEENPFRKQIVMGTTFVIFAYNNNDPICDEDDVCPPEIHDMLSMGSQSINFFSGESNVVEMPDVYDSFSFTMTNYSVPPVDTIYHCKMVELPTEITEESHMIRNDPVIQEGNEGVVHHILLYWCTQPLVNYTNYEADCNEFANMPTHPCQGSVLIATWAVGGGNFFYPAHVGLPFQNKVYALLEIHYDNQDLRSDIIDSSGIKVYWTPELREYEAGYAIIGAHAARVGYDQIWIPGDIDESVLTSYHSSPDCTGMSDINPDEGINIFASLLHAHTIGAGMKLRQIRDNNELQTVIQNDNYDFNYQQWIALHNERKVYPGDEFVCDCLYNTNRAYPTYGGQGSRDEMCQCWVYYYPRSNWVGGRSSFTQQQWTDFFQIAIDNGWWNGTTDWAVNRANMDVYYYDGKAEGALEHYVKFQESINRIANCGGSQSEYIVPEGRDEFKPLDEDDFGNCNEDEDVDEDKGLSDTQIIIISSVAAVVGLVAIFGLFVCCRTKKKREAMKKYENMEDVEQSNYGATAQ